MEVESGAELILNARDIDDELEVVVTVAEAEVLRETISFGSTMTSIDISSVVGLNSAVIDLSLINGGVVTPMPGS